MKRSLRVAPLRTPAFRAEGEHLVGQMQAAVKGRDAWKLILAARRMELLVGDPEDVEMNERTEAIERFAAARAFEEAGEILAELEWTFTLRSQPGLASAGLVAC